MRGVASLLLLFAATLLQGLCWAQSVRDPTVAPASAAIATGAPNNVSLPDLAIGPMLVVKREGRAFLVVGTRLYAQGQMLGDARIERIGETAVWLRQGKVLSKREFFPGIERRPMARAECALPAPGPRPAKRSAVAAAAATVPPPEICPP